MENIFQILAFSALLAPLASFIILSFLPARYTNIQSLVSLILVFLGFISAALLLFSFWNQPPLAIDVPWFSVGRQSITANLAVSNRSLLMLVVVSFISLLVHLYSIAYMAGDRDFKRYFALLGFFTFSMQGIVLSDNLLFLFIFWELVGFSSYMLIGHWTNSFEAGRAATKAFVMNRIGDAAFLTGLMIIWVTYGTFNLPEIFLNPAYHPWQTAASLCIFGGVIGKSAQFPLFTWLPDAMEGPTPVSALIHAATMVAAGVYLLVRLYTLFTADALLFVAITGMLTTVIGALAALSQYDIKKILAYSTISQLGLMITAIGMGVVDAALVHLLAHAFFKACLFLSAGMIIHSLHKANDQGQLVDVQDIRHMGGLRKKLPTAFIAFLLSGASLAGVPFFSGFLSKEAILTALFMHGGLLSWFMLVIIVSVSFLTVVYTFRMVWFIFLGEERTVKSLLVREPPPAMRLPVLILAACSLWFLVSWNPFHFKGWILPKEEPVPFSIWITLVSTLWVMGALVLSWYVFRKNRFRTSAVLRNGFYADAGYALFVKKVIHTSSRATAYVDRYWIDGSIHFFAYAQVTLAHLTGWFDHYFIDGLVNAVARLTGFGGKITRSFQGGNIQLYIFWAVLGIIIFIIWTLK